MAVNIEIYSNDNVASRTLTIDFAAELRSSSIDGLSNQMEYFFKLNANAVDATDKAFMPKIVNALDQLALNRTKQAIVNTANAYSNVHEMITDYIYDFVNGHAQDKFSSGASYQAPMKFS